MITFLIAYLTLSLVMGMFSVTQMQYQDRLGGLKELFRGIYNFGKGVLAWPILLPLGIRNKKYRFNVYHKIISRKS